MGKRSFLFKLVLGIFLGLFVLMQVQAETVYPTGLKAKKGYLAVSPDGEKVIFETNYFSHGLRLLDTKTKTISVIPQNAGRTLGHPRWSPDGSRIVLVSTAIENNYFNLDDMKIVLLDTKNWNEKIISASQGVNIFPFFSQDGKQVYYFKGKKREEGKTPAANYDLYSIDLESYQETRLTYKEFFQVNRGDDNGQNIVITGEKMESEKQKQQKQPQIVSLLETPFQSFIKKILAIMNIFIENKKSDGHKNSYNELLESLSWEKLYRIDKKTKAISMIDVHDPENFFEFRSPRYRRSKEIYFISKRKSLQSGWFLSKADQDGSNPKVLQKVSIVDGFDIAQETGDIFIIDKIREEIVIKKL